MKRWCLVALCAFYPAIGQSVTVAGKRYEETATIEGKSLYLLGAGIRQLWFFKVYAMAAYSASGKCDPQALIDTDEAKYLRLDMLRTVSAEKMASTIGDAFAAHIPKDASAELRQQRATFESYFKDECSKDTALEFSYLPGTGTLIKQNGKQLGPPLVGHAFARILWEIYFGAQSCCQDLKAEILNGCK